jgi:hypothetical protein
MFGAKSPRNLFANGADGVPLKVTIMRMSTAVRCKCMQSSVVVLIQLKCMSVVALRIRIGNLRIEFYSSGLKPAPLGV